MLAWVNRKKGWCASIDINNSKSPLATIMQMLLLAKMCFYLTIFLFYYFLLVIIIDALLNVTINHD